MTTILTYDVSGRQQEVRAEMLARGYRDRGTPGERRARADRTLWKGEIALATALEDIAAVARKLRVKIRRAVVVPSPADCTAP
ncbi:MAG TPA: hypothetical protein VFG59_14115 [Anaeromyxobacter sp.]|nr:hypothetical protein [Anaeromyxobacter sp.]